MRSLAAVWAPAGSIAFTCRGVQVGPRDRCLTAALKTRLVHYLPNSAISIAAMLAADSTFGS